MLSVLPGFRAGETHGDGWTFACNRRVCVARVLIAACCLRAASCVLCAVGVHSSSPVHSGRYLAVRRRPAARRHHRSRAARGGLELPAQLQSDQLPDFLDAFPLPLAVLVQLALEDASRHHLLHRIGRAAQLLQPRRRPGHHAVLQDWTLCALRQQAERGGSSAVPPPHTRERWLGLRAPPEGRSRYCGFTCDCCRILTPRVSCAGCRAACRAGRQALCGPTCTCSYRYRYL